MKLISKMLVAVAFAVTSFVANASNVHGVLRVVKGDVQIKSGETGSISKARLGGKVFPKDVVITGKESRAKIVMIDNNELNVSPDSQIELQNYEYDPAAGKKDVLLNVIYGKVRSKVEQKYDGKTSNFRVKTPSAVAGVRGTDFITGFNKVDRSTSIITFEGKVEFGLPGAGNSIVGAVSVTPGTTASTNGSAPPSEPVALPKEELAKMDNDSKADTAKSSSGAADERTPAADEKKEEKKDEKKDEPKKEEAKKDEPKREEAKRDEPKKDEAKGNEPKTAASSTGPKEGSRDPSSIPPGSGALPPPIEASAGGKGIVIAAPPPPAFVPNSFVRTPSSDGLKDTVRDVTSGSKRGSVKIVISPTSP